MVTLAMLLDGIADQLRTNLTGLGVDMQIEGRPILNPSSPYIDMTIPSPSDDQDLAAFGELIGGHLIQIRAAVPAGDFRSGVDLLLALMDDEDPFSIMNAITDPTLNGIAAAFHFRARSGLEAVPDLSGEGSWLGCHWDIVIVKASS